MRATERLPQADCFDLPPFSLALGLRHATLTLTPSTCQFPPWPLFAHFLALTAHIPQDRALLTSLRILTSHLHTDCTHTPKWHSTLTIHSYSSRTTHTRSAITQCTHTHNAITQSIHTHSAMTQHSHTAYLHSALTNTAHSHNALIQSSVAGPPEIKDNSQTSLDFIIKTYFM